MSYKKSKYFRKNKKIRIKYFYLNKNSLITIVFFHGFMSDMIGEKPKAILKYCRKKKINFLKFEYSGHGRSSGKFTSGNISKWTSDAKQLIEAKTKGKLLFVGSSMGSWIALNLFPIFKKRIYGFMGIASAPEFLENLMWKRFGKKIKKNIIKNKIYNMKAGNHTYPITKQLIFDGRKNKVLNNKINLKIFITLFHGLKDEVVPISFSKKIFKICKNSKRKLILLKNGNHSLSKKNDLKKICNELDHMIFNRF